MAEQDGKEANETTLSVKLPKNLIDSGSKATQAVKGSILIFLIGLVLSILWALWLFPEYREKLPLPYTYITFIATVGVAAVSGTWAHLTGVQQERDRLLEERKRDSFLATVQREKNDLLVERDKLVKDLQDARDNHQRCQELLAKCIPTKS